MLKNYFPINIFPTFCLSGVIQEAIISYNFANFKQLDTQTEFLTETLKDLKHGKQFWKLFIALAVLFLASELFLIRFWKA